VTGEIGTCGVAYCDRPAVAYVSRTGVTRTSGGRLLTIVGSRADWLANTGTGEVGGVTDLRCLDCAHDELDALLNEAATVPFVRADGNPFADSGTDDLSPSPSPERSTQP
jgi:hypothetical protein